MLLFQDIANNCVGKSLSWTHSGSAPKDLEEEGVLSMATLEGQVNDWKHQMNTESKDQIRR